MSGGIATVIDSAEDIVLAAVQAIQHADQTNTPRDIDDAITRWELVIHIGMDPNSPEDQFGFLLFYATALRKRWHLSHNPEDMRKEITSLENALTKIPQGSTQGRYDTLILLASAYQALYQSTKTRESLPLAIRCWEEAYGMSAILRRMREAASEVLPGLANSLFISFKDGLSGINTLQQALGYYQIAVLQGPSQQQHQLRLQLGKAYLESMARTQDVANMQMALGCFEAVIQNTQSPEEVLEASNGKSQCLLLGVIMDRTQRVTDRRAAYPLREWTLKVAKQYPYDVDTISHLAMSALWFTESQEDDFTWFDMAWSLSRSKRQPLPPMFHFFYAFKLIGSGLGLSTYIRALEHFVLFASTATMLDAYLIQRAELYPIWRASAQIWPGSLEGDQWAEWKSETLARLLAVYNEIARTAFETWSRRFGPFRNFDPESDPVHFSGKGQTELKAELEARIVKPTNPV